MKQIHYHAHGTGGMRFGCFNRFKQAGLQS